VRNVHLSRFQSPTGVRGHYIAWNSTLLHFPKCLVGMPEENQRGSLTMANASAAIGSAVCFTPTLAFFRFATDQISSTSFGLTFLELNLGTVSLISWLGLDGAMIGCDWILEADSSSLKHHHSRGRASLRFSLVPNIRKRSSS